MQRDLFLFYRSFFESLQQLGPEDRLAAYDAICSYALNGEETPLEGPPAAVLLMARPILDKSRKRAESGRKGGQAKGKEKATVKQTESKTEAKPKQKKTSQLSAEQLSLFEQFYASYPKKVDRATAERAWAKIKPEPDGEFTKKVIAAVEQAIKYDNRFRERQFVPNPASWLNAKGYLNEYEQEGGERNGGLARIAETPQTGSTSHPREDSATQNNVVTPKEAARRGIPWNREPPEDKNCKFCGRTLEHEGLVFAGRVITWRSTPRRCTCERAQAYWARQDQKEAERKASEEEQQRRAAMQRRVERLLGRSGIKKRFLQRTFPNFLTNTPGRKRSYDVAKEYADNFPDHMAQGDGLYIEGTNGTGKTHLAAAIALQLIGQGIPVICKTSSDLLMDIKTTYDADGANEAQVLGLYKAVDLLIIDDLGKEQCSDWSVSTLYSILNDRYEDMKPTIITTNYNADDLISALTPKGMDNKKIVAIVSRLRETSTVLTMVWEDIRGREEKMP